MRQYIDDIKREAERNGVWIADCELHRAITIAGIEASKDDDEIKRLRQVIVDRNLRINQHKDLESRLDAKIAADKSQISLLGALLDEANAKLARVARLSMDSATKADELVRDLTSERDLLRTEKATLRDAWADMQYGLRMFRAVFGPPAAIVEARLTRDQAFAYYALAQGKSIDAVHISDADVETLQNIDARLRKAREMA